MFRRYARAQRHARRQLRSRRLVDDFFAWAKAQYALVKDARGLVATAFGYAVRQEPGLRSLFDDGRLPMTNNHSERALRFICGGRKAWLFFGSDDHAAAAAHNLQGEKQAFLERSVHYDELSPESIAMLTKQSKELGMQALLAVNKSALAAEINDASSEAPRQRMTFGVYFYAEPSPQESTKGAPE